MISDIVETNLDPYQHQRVINLRQNKAGKWETVKGFVAVSGAFTDKVKSFIEVTSDETNERFLLLNIGDGLYRLDYDPVNGYVDTSNISVNLLPSGISLLKSRMRFNKTGNQIRITGLSKPVIYERIKRDLFTYSNQVMHVNSWIIEPANIDDDSNNFQIITSISNTYASAEQNTDPQYLANAISFLMDNGQFTKPMNITPQNISKAASFKISVNIYLNSGQLYNKRLLGFAVLESQQPISAQMNEIPWQIVDIIYFDQEKIITYVPDDLIIDSADTTGQTIAIAKTNFVPKYHNANSWNKDDLVTINIPDSVTGEYSSFQGTVQTVVDGNYSIRITIPGIDFSSQSNCSKDVDIGDGSKTYNCISGAFVKIQKRFNYDSANNRYQMNLGYAYSDGLSDFYDYTKRSPIGNHAPNYDDHFIIGGRAFINSLEEGESDIIRYSPEGQYDVFPPDFIIETPNGDTDKVKLAQRINDRFIILKRKSGTFGSFMGNSFTQHTDFMKKGLYPDNGWIIVDGTLFFMDTDDVYSFDGINANSIFSKEKMRIIYRKYVDEKSFIVYNKLDHEMWFVLSDRTIVWHFEQNEFYERETEALFDWAILDSENRMLLNNSADNKIVTFNHSQDTFDEEIRFYVQTRIFNMQRQGRFKKLDKVSLYLSSNSPITVTAKAEAMDPKAIKFIEDMAQMFEYHQYPNYLYKSLGLTIESNKLNNLSAEIRQINLETAIWI